MVLPAGKRRPAHCWVAAVRVADNGQLRHAASALRDALGRRYIGEPIVELRK